MNLMPKPLKIFLFVLGGLAGALLLAALAVVFFVDVNDYKPKVEEAASNALKMEVNIDGPLAIGLWSGLHLTAENVRIRNRGTELALLKEVDLAIQILPLFQREIRYGNIATKGARISIERSQDGTYNYQRPLAVGAASRPLTLPEITFADLIVAYTDKQTAKEFAFNGCNGSLTDMRHPGSAPFLKRLSVSGQFTCSEVRGKTEAAGKKAAVTDLKFSVDAIDGVFDFKPVTMQAYGGQGSGSLRMDRSVEPPTLAVNYALSKFHIEEFFHPTASGKSVSGRMDFSTTLTMRGRTRPVMRQSANGEMSLSGSNLTLNGMDLDKKLQKFEASQNFNLIDVGALFFAGPLGLAATKGYEFSTLAEPTDGSTPIRKVVSHWKVEKGVALARDVALATDENRLAMHGGLDFVTDEYRDVTVAVIDPKGCAKVMQKVSGAFSKPTVDKSALTVVAGPLVKLLDKAKSLIAGPDNKCEVFYSGTLAPPK